MKTNVLILVLAFLFSFNLNAQETRTLQRKGDVSAAKQMITPNAETISQFQGKKLAKHLSLSEAQYEAVTGLIAKHYNTDKYQKIIGSLSNDQIKTIGKEPNFSQDYIASILFTDDSFTKELSTVIDAKQMTAFKELINTGLAPK